MKYLSLLVLSLTACVSTRSSVPPAFGFRGTVRPHRLVVCMIDKDMTHERCEDVARAVDKVDEAVGFELLQHPIEIRLSDLASMHFTGESEVILVGVDTLPEGTLGVTLFRVFEQGTGLYRSELVVFDPQIWNDPLARESCILHELTHAVGAGHADQTGPFESVMRPAYAPGAPINFTAADLAALRAAYH